MKKVICDICATAYPSSAACCPICGSSREYALENQNAEAMLEAEIAAAVEEVPAAPRKKNKEIFDYDEVNQIKPARKLDMDDYDDDDDDDEDDEEEESRTNVGLVIVLVILIVLLLLTAGFFAVKYLLPNMSKTDVTEPVVTTEALQTEPVETTDGTVPCTSITIVEGGLIELGKDGKFLMNVQAYPEDTTDTLTYTSADEAVVTVAEDGSVTAVGEGETTITVQCGGQAVICHVTVAFEEVEETVPEGTIPGMEVEDTTEATEATDATEAAAATEAAEETAPADAALKLKKDDITISSNYTSVNLELEGDVDPATLKWFTMDSTVAICHEGVVTSTGSGLTKIYGEANGQQVVCVVRCIF